MRADAPKCGPSERARSQLRRQFRQSNEIVGYPKGNYDELRVTAGRHDQPIDRALTCITSREVSGANRRKGRFAHRRRRQPTAPTATKGGTRRNDPLSRQLASHDATETRASVPDLIAAPPSAIMATCYARSDQEENVAVGSEGICSVPTFRLGTSEDRGLQEGRNFRKSSPQHPSVGA